MALRQVKDTPTNNFATLNPLHKDAGVTLLDGNTKYSNTSNSNKDVSSTIIIPSTTGLWYIEFFQVTGLQTDVVFGFGSPTYDYISSPDLAGSGNFIGYTYAGRKWSFGTQTNNLTTLTVNTDVLTFCIDSSNGKAWAGKNGVWFASGDPSTGANPFYTFTAGTKFVTAIPVYNSTGYVNFGQNPDFSGQKSGGGNHPDANGLGSFYYQPPAGALALCSRNIQSVEQDGSYVQNYTSTKANFRAVTYTGTGGTQSITGVGFEADLIWCKGRDTSTNHRLHDTVRGVGSTLSTTISAGEDTTNGLAGTHSNGFSLSSSSNVNQVHDYVAWCWKAGGAPTSDNSAVEGSAMVDGTPTKIDDIKGSASITPSKMSVNTKAGFSIVKYTGITTSNVQDTIPHGLNNTPEFIIIRDLDNATNWRVYHKDITVNETLYLNLPDTDVAGADIIYSPNTNTITLGNGTSDGGGVARNNTAHICYAWHSVAGFSAFGSYTGNGSPDGPFAYTGFRPAWVMIKRYDTTGDWWIGDTTREPFNGGRNTYDWLIANLTNKEGDYTAIDHLSNGFKLLDAHGGLNGSGGKYIYMAFAEQPGAFSNAR